MTEMQSVGLVLMIVPVVIVMIISAVTFVARRTGDDVELGAIFLAVVFLVGLVLLLAGGA